MAEQLFTDGDVIVAENTELECVAVTTAEVDENTKYYAYTFRVKSELDAEREAEAQRQAELEATAPEAPAEVPEEVSEPVNNQEEETQYVK
jgi:hypothetical protein